MTDGDARILATLCAADFTRAYCHSYNNSLRISHNGVTFNPRDVDTLHKAAYMISIYRHSPVLFRFAVRRWESHNYEPGTPMADFVARCEAWCTTNIQAS